MDKFEINDMFATPENMDVVMDMIEPIPSEGGAKVAAIAAVMMAVNYVAKMHNDMVEAEEGGE